MIPAHTVESLIQKIEAKDLCTAAHTWRVVLYARAMAEAAGLDHATIGRITRGAALHDLGKLDVPDAVLQKAGPLSPAEFEIIKTHPGAGFCRLRELGEDDDLILTLVRSHHERMDGTGYPDGLKGGAIPGPARSFAVIDSFDAMTSVRPYRANIGEAAAERALEELEAGIGTRYCAESVEMFCNLYREGALRWVHEYFNTECPIPDHGAGWGTVVGRAKRRVA